MQNRQITVFLLALFCSLLGARGQTGTLAGVVRDSATALAVDYATVYLKDYDLFATTDLDGRFAIARVPSGKTLLSVSHLGYAPKEVSVTIGTETAVEVMLAAKNLELKGVTIHAQRKKNEATTSYLIDRTSIDHLQAINITDIAALLPGGQTSPSDKLTSAQLFALRSGGSGEIGSSSFGTAVEVDGTRLSNNASFGDNPSSRLSSNPLLSLYGSDTRNVSSANIQSIEVITGVPSVEYGDLTNGLVKINTLKGKSPLTVEFVSKPHTRQYSAGKGVTTENGTTLNAHFERAESTADLASPYTTYDRNAFSLTYNRTWNKHRVPLRMQAGLSGNIGGYNTKNDPDLYKETFTEIRDNSLRGNVNLDWQFNKPWITSVSASGSFSYTDKLYTEQQYKSSASPTAAIHTTEEGYYSGEGYERDHEAGIVVIPPGAWYQRAHNDSKPVAYTAKAKALRITRWNEVSSRAMVGAEFTSTGNEGRGTYYEDLSLAPTWRERKYSDEPYMHNLAVYGEERIGIPLNDRDLQVTAGMRSEWTFINRSAYGTTYSLSPRFNLKYDLPLETGLLRKITLRAGYGEAVKLPSFAVLYPATSYTDLQVFTPLDAYYTYPVTATRNSALKWQRDRLHELGIDADVAGVKVSFSFFYNKTLHPYVSRTDYTPFSYNYTDPKALDSSPIPSSNRQLNIDPSTGVVTVSDLTNAYPAQELPYTQKNTFKASPVSGNASPVTRRGIEWVVDFEPIPLLRTAVRIDGKYYSYKGVDETVYPSVSSHTMSDGSPYQYIGYYVGSTSATYNGSNSKRLNMNLNLTTHIPEVRLIVSLRLESTLYINKRNISQYNGSPLAFVIDSRDSYHPSDGQADIYGGNRFVGVYPLYYTTHAAPDTQIPFAESFEWARENDQILYNDLSKMVQRTYYNYIFNKNTVSPFYSANFAITKEIGKVASITFSATNFFNNTSRVKSGWTRTESTLYGSNYIPRYYYGLSLRLKI